MCTKEAIRFVTWIDVRLENTPKTVAVYCQSARTSTFIPLIIAEGDVSPIDYDYDYRLGDSYKVALRPLNTRAPASACLFWAHLLAFGHGKNVNHHTYI
jgi:hypothetical protein